jgi:hypothetical protein
MTGWKDDIKKKKNNTGNKLFSTTTVRETNIYVKETRTPATKSKI